MPSFTFRCGWCGSKDQTADVVSHHKHVYKDYRYNDVKEFRLSLLCRRCKNFSSVTAMLEHAIPGHLQKYAYSGLSDINEKLFEDSGDITGVFRSNYDQMPLVSSQMSAALPASVSESLLDADEARSPRAKCQSYRTALEFGLREANIANAPGKTLGELLVEARKTVAMPDALIELCDQVKAFGNWGLHWSETQITDNDAVAAKTIAKAVLDYLFVLPAEVAKAKSRTQQAKDNHKASTSKGAGN